MTVATCAYTGRNNGNIWHGIVCLLVGNAAQPISKLGLFIGSAIPIDPERMVGIVKISAIEGDPLNTAALFRSLLRKYLGIFTITA